MEYKVRTVDLRISCHFSHLLCPKQVPRSEAFVQFTYQKIRHSLILRLEELMETVRSGRTKDICNRYQFYQEQNTASSREEGV